MMQSLRMRLLVALLATILLCWGAMLAFSFVHITREQTGEVDATLREVATSILLSSQANLDALPASETLRLPPGASYAGDKVSYQTWLRAGKSIWRSPGAPAVPFSSDFADGFADRQVEGVAWRVYALSDADGRFQVQVARRQSQIDAELGRKATVSLTFALLLFAMLVAVIWSVVLWSLRPVTEVRAALQQRQPLDLTPLPAAKLPAELRPLVESFNRVLEQLDRAVQGERRFIADAAHELRTPLAAMLAHTQVAQRAGTLEAKNAALAQVSAAVQRGARLSEQLLDLARLDAGEVADRRSPVELHELAAVVLSDFESLAQQRQQVIVFDIEPCVIHGDTDELGILVRNLVDNALRYTGEGGRIAVSCRYAQRNGLRAVHLRFADDGPGVPEGERERIFDRFHRVAGNGTRGSGIGLSLVARIARSHGAALEVGAGLDGRGLGISLWFDEAAAREQSAPLAVSSGGVALALRLARIHRAAASAADRLGPRTGHASARAHADSPAMPGVHRRRNQR